MGIMPSIFLPFRRLCQTASLMQEALVIAGKVVLYILFPRSLAREDVLSSKGVALSSSMAMCGLVVPSNSHLMRIFLMVHICLSRNPWPLGWDGLLVVNLNQYCAAKFLYSCAMNCFPLSQMISSTLLYSEMIDSRAEITFILDIDSNSLNTGNFEQQSHTRRYHLPLQKNRSIPIFCHGLKGTSIAMLGPFVVTWLQFGMVYSSLP